MQNILELKSAAFGGDAVTRLSTILRESPTALQRGVEFALPASLVGLSRYAASNAHAVELLSTLRQGDYPRIAPGSFLHVVRDASESTRIADAGTSFLQRILGNRLGGIVETLASQAGLSRASASTLLGLSAPLVLDAVGKEVAEKQLDAPLLSRFLGDEGRKVSGLLPQPVVQALSFSTTSGWRETRAVDARLSQAPRPGTRVYARTHLPELEPRRNALWFIVPFALLTVFGVWWFYRVYVQRPLDFKAIQEERRPMQTPGGLKQHAPSGGLEPSRQHPPGQVE